MARGIIKLPVEMGRKELVWLVGRALVQGSNVVNPIVQIRNNKDADYVVKRLWLVYGPPAAAPGGTPGPEFPGYTWALPADASVTLREGTTSRELSLAGGLAQSMVANFGAVRAPNVMLGLPAPYLMRANSVLTAEVACPSRAGTAWDKDLYLVAEGYKLYPNESEPIPASIQAYALPYRLNGTINLVEPNPANVGSLSEQILTITNNGEGKFIAKGMSVMFQMPGSVEGTMNYLSGVGINIDDSTSGSKPWVQDATPNAGIVRCPLPAIIGNYAELPWCAPRLLDENAVVRVRFVWEAYQVTGGYIGSLGAFPMNCSVSLFGALLPRGMA